MKVENVPVKHGPVSLEQWDKELGKRYHEYPKNLAKAYFKRGYEFEFAVKLLKYHGVEK